MKKEKMITDNVLTQYPVCDCMCSVMEGLDASTQWCVAVNAISRILPENKDGGCVTISPHFLNHWEQNSAVNRDISSILLCYQIIDYNYTSYKNKHLNISITKNCVGGYKTAVLLGFFWGGEDLLAFCNFHQMVTNFLLGSSSASILHKVYIAD